LVPETHAFLFYAMIPRVCNFLPVYFFAPAKLFMCVYVVSGVFSFHLMKFV